VIPAAVGALATRAGDPSRLVAAIGPHIGACCYEVDAPVLLALRPRFGAALEAALTPSRPGHQQLDLLSLCRTALLGAGLAPGAIGAIPDACTRCDGKRFHSYRRDGPRAGRLVHWIARPLEA
jgi:copper oxidase (laccase) domain-containing protein